jgi:hypothetical protein
MSSTSSAFPLSIKIVPSLSPPIAQDQDTEAKTECQGEAEEVIPDSPYP